MTQLITQYSIPHDRSGKRPTGCSGSPNTVTSLGARGASPKDALRLPLFRFPLSPPPRNELIFLSLSLLERQPLEGTFICVVVP